ncbi:hypothetical protein KZJ38_07410 [Paraburkholderia edwinii]|uniref:Uncharacterized protein n=1 Tax=Paraburkholderia edwinii TaxID=2861782 RepID=A0ABX8UM94_9BURK|nr:hypothetical protein [Paraburkholderia edwinii]QYD70128.1 hypothetical protein KZJ38_07410 [Paraburkholderia edwinii]
MQLLNSLLLLVVSALFLVGVARTIEKRGRTKLDVGLAVFFAIDVAAGIAGAVLALVA